ncbi:unnamed protein product [Protopolystoma xenopodis]|uniref:CRIB domain-containing protein n=1 Tax=Protopolystoma xenopodis TaxID=117903 RepID=A0A448WQ98_9PLAT|nr:unnamed protein product [Protopolystoma xenopodis]
MAQSQGTVPLSTYGTPVSHNSVALATGGNRIPLVGPSEFSCISQSAVIARHPHFQHLQAATAANMANGSENASNSSDDHASFSYRSLQSSSSQASLGGSVSRKQPRSWLKNGTPLISPPSNMQHVVHVSPHDAAIISCKFSSCKYNFCTYGKLIF